MTFEKNSNNWLTEFGVNVTSQNGEDGIIEKILQLIPDCNHWCVEFGAWDGKYMSNVWRLITEREWHGVLIEASTKRYTDLCKTYQPHTKALCLNKFVNFEGNDTLDQILAKTQIPMDYDLLSIDIDGNDYHIWESLHVYQPKIILIEFNPSIPNNIEFIQPKDVRINQGNSLLSLCKLAKEKGYELIATTACNAFFVQSKYFDLFKIEDNSPSAMNQNSSLQTQIFQLYDGTLVISGCKKLIWHNFDISQDSIQVLPRIFRTYPENYTKSQRFLVKIAKMIHRILFK